MIRMSLSKPKNGNGSPATSSPAPKHFHIMNHVKYEHMVAGVSGGVASTLVLHPLDLLKVRFAVNDGSVTARPQYQGLKNAVAMIVKEEGYRGLYRGVTPNCWGAGAAWGFYFLLSVSVCDAILVVFFMFTKQSYPLVSFTVTTPSKHT